MNCAEQALWESGWRFLEQQAAVLVLRVAGDGTVRFANRYARELTGLELVSAPLEDLLIVTEEAVDRGRWLSQSERPQLMNVRTASGLPQTLYLTSVPLGEEWLLFGQTDPREQELLRRELLVLNHEATAQGRALAQANAELAHLNAVKNEFLGMASHDLRKPVGLILNCAESLQELASLSPEAHRDLEQVVTCATSMARLIDDFLDVASIEAQRLPLDLQVVGQEHLVEAALSLVRPAAGRRGVTLARELDGTSARLRVDGPKLEQVLANLLGNAVEHSPAGGRVLLVSRCQPEGVRFWVEDQGEGVGPEQQQRLFTAFAGSGAVKPGGERSMGLGLAVVRTIVAAHGGSCFVESQPGRGARFGFLLPASCLGVNG